MRQGADYSMTTNDWTIFGNALKGGGRDFVGRYLWHGPKGATRAEVQALRALGIEIFFYYESTEGRALAGVEAGKVDAHNALSLLAQLEAPDDLPIIMTVDTDTNLAKVMPYFQGANEILGLNRMGAYGGYHVIKGLFDAGLITYAVQTEAWSYLNGSWPNHPVWDERAQVHQWTSHNGAPIKICGIDCDFLQAVADDFGQWRISAQQDPKVPPPPTIQRTLKVTSPLMTGNDILWVQKKLCAQEFLVEIDGIYGNETANAISDFQKTNNIDDDGICGPQTWAKLII